jgi:TctA family transporter|tara:strand:+ start:3442 stop:4953 length:1512 start_codon:yes stop_codon:yes gene_type:complete
MWYDYVMWAMIGTCYGMLVGIIPIAGVTTALITVFSMGAYFMADPYLGLVFLTAIVASCASADSYTSILTGIPGASTTAACVIDGYPMAQKGQAARAMGIAIADSTFNGVLYAGLCFILLPYYGKIIVLFGRPEFLGFMMMALACVGFVASKNVFMSIIAIIFGLSLGLVGQDVVSNPRLAFGWEYLENGIGMVVLLSGLFGIPELLDGFRRGLKSAAPKIGNDYWKQLMQGFRDVRIHWKDMMRGGFIGFVTGLLPGVGGAVGDFLAYGATKAAHKEKQEIPFGEGNPIGLLGCEGANNAQKVSSMIPAVLFGIPAAPFAAMVMAICMYFGMEIGSPELIYDEQFTTSLAFGYIFGTIGVALLSIFLYKWIIKILEVPYWIYAVFIMAVIVYANMQYTGGWEDLALLMILSAIGVVCKHFNISRPAILVAYVVAFKIDEYFWGTLQLYGYKMWKPGFSSMSDFRWFELFNIWNHPIFIVCIIISLAIFINSVVRKDRGIDYV